MNIAQKTSNAIEAQQPVLIKPSRWIEINQDRINAFADITEDHQFIHLDDARAKQETPFGGTIAHGFLTLSMASAFAYDCLPEVTGQTASINYGFDKIRFLSPVRSGQRIRGQFEFISILAKGENAVLQTHQLTIEIEDEQRPALIAHWLTLHQLDG